LHLFSTRAELLVYGRRHYHIHSSDGSTLLLELFWRIREEIGAMSTALEEFARETIDKLLKQLPLDKRLELIKEVPVEKRLEGLTPEQRVQGLSAEELLALAKKVKDKASPPKT
jgi:hypothetical protein